MKLSNQNSPRQIKDNNRSSHIENTYSKYLQDTTRSDNKDTDNITKSNQEFNLLNTKDLNQMERQMKLKELNLQPTSINLKVNNVPKYKRILKSKSSNIINSKLNEHKLSILTSKTDTQTSNSNQNLKSKDDNQ